MKRIDLATGVLVAVGGLNWGVVAAGERDDVTTLFRREFGETSAATRLVYGLVGLAALYRVAGAARRLRSDGAARAV